MTYHLERTRSGENPPVNQSFLFDKERKFPEKLYDVVNDRFTLVAWNEEGTGFRVNQDRFEAEVMKKYPGFMQICSFMNFRRQLRWYSFFWENLGGGDFEFSHPGFIKDRPDLLMGILTRRKSLNTCPDDEDTPVGKRIRRSSRIKSRDSDDSEAPGYKIKVSKLELGQGDPEGICKTTTKRSDEGDPGQLQNDTWSPGQQVHTPDGPNEGINEHSKRTQWPAGGISAGRNQPGATPISSDKPNCCCCCCKCPCHVDKCTSKITPVPVMRSWVPPLPGDYLYYWADAEVYNHYDQHASTGEYQHAMFHERAPPFPVAGLDYGLQLPQPKVETSL